MLLAAKDRGAAELEPASCAKGRRSNASNYAREPTTNDFKRDHLSLSMPSKSGGNITFTAFNACSFPSIHHL
jgi:hypothetical protein